MFLLFAKSILNQYTKYAFDAALSFKLKSSLGVTNDSVIDKPTLYDADVYLSRIGLD